jgi:hypothetical protein
LMNTLAASESLAGRGSAGWVHRTHADYIRALGRACAPAQHLDSGASTIYSMCQCDFSPACAACGRRPRPASARRLISLMGDLQTELHWQTRMARRTRPGGRLPAVVHTVLSNCGSPPAEIMMDRLAYSEWQLEAAWPRLVRRWDKNRGHQRDDASSAAADISLSKSISSSLRRRCPTARSCQMPVCCRRQCQCAPQAQRLIMQALPGSRAKLTYMRAFADCRYAFKFVKKRC